MGRGDEGLDRLHRLEEALSRRGSELALFIVYDRPTRVADRPALARTYFAERCVSDDELARMIDAFRSIGAYVELFDGDQPFVRALADGRLHQLGRRLLVAYNGIGFGITAGGFEPGRRALIPALADSFRLVSANSGAYASALALHRFHSFLVLRALGVPAPPVWQLRPGAGWVGDPPPHGTKVIAKSTYEAWSVGVTEESVFVVDGDAEDRVDAIARDIGQPVTVQRFVAGREVCMPIVATPTPYLPPPLEMVITRAPGDPEAIATLDDNMERGAIEHRPFVGSRSEVDAMERSARRAFDVLQAEAFGRMDFRIDAGGTPWLTDAAITPGWSTRSSAFASLAQVGFDHPAFLRLIVAANLASRGLLDVD